MKDIIYLFASLVRSSIGSVSVF